MRGQITVTKDELPMRVTLVESGKRVEYELKSAGKKRVGLQLIKPEPRPRADDARG